MSDKSVKQMRFLVRVRGTTSDMIAFERIGESAERIGDAVSWIFVRALPESTNTVQWKNFSHAVRRAYDQHAGFAADVKAMSSDVVQVGKLIRKSMRAAVGEKLESRAVGVAGLGRGASDV